MSNRSIRALAGVAVVFGAATAARAATITLEPMKDNTLYHDPAGTTSNGAGAHFFSGQTLTAELRRGLLAFDIAGHIPAGAEIVSVTLRLNMSRTQTLSGLTEINLHRALTDWGEAGSDAPLEEGEGAPAEPGDATWLHTFYDTGLWETPGGDFTPMPSATAAVDAVGQYTWGPGPAMTTDVQLWLDEPASNFGWVVVGDESGEAPTTKRFDTREEPIADNRPRLTIEYALAVPALSSWGTAGLTLVILIAGTIVFMGARCRSVSHGA